MTGRRVAWLGLSSPPALTRRTPTKRSALRLRGGVALRSSLTLPRFPGLLHGLAQQHPQMIAKHRGTAQTGGSTEIAGFGGRMDANAPILIII